MFFYGFFNTANLKSNDAAFRKMLKEVFPNISKRTLDLVIPRIPRGNKDFILFHLLLKHLIKGTFLGFL